MLNKNWSKKRAGAAALPQNFLSKLININEDESLRRATGRQREREGERKEDFTGKHPGGPR